MNGMIWGNVVWEEADFMSGIILVGVDNTNTALTAAEKAASLATALKTELHVVSAYGTAEAGVPRVQPGANPDQVAAVMEAHRETIAQLRDEAQDAADDVVDTLRSKFVELNAQAR